MVIYFILKCGKCILKVCAPTQKLLFLMLNFMLSTEASTFIRQAGGLNFIVLEDLATDSKAKGGAFHTQPSTPGVPETESLGL